MSIYNPFTPTTGVPTPTLFSQFQQPLQQIEIQKVMGEESARNYPLAPNSSIILLDANNPLIWVVTTDASGYKTVNPFTITPYTPEKPLSQADINDQLEKVNARLDKLEERMHKYGQSYYGSSWKNKSGNAGNSTNVRNRQDSQGSASDDQPIIAE